MIDRVGLDPALSFASRYVRAVLDDVGASDLAPAVSGGDPDLEWAASGAMALTGHAGGPPLLAPAPLASAARAAINALAAVAEAAESASSRELRTIDAAALLGERAAVSGLTRRGRTSPGGSCHLVRAHDGWIAVNLARPEDVCLLPAWLGEGDATDAFAFLTSRVRGRRAHELVAAARELGLAVAHADAAVPDETTDSWHRIAVRGARTRSRRRKPPMVIDLSALWAGPLATHLLSLAGARVIKVESSRRNDGARRGPRAFYDLLNAGKESVVLDFATSEGREALGRLVEYGDIVVEASRPRALRQLGIDAERIVRTHPGKVWVSITGYGREEPQGNWIAFGDDAAAAGLAAAASSWEDTGPVFCADAVADPMTGMHAALAALAHWRAGGGVLVDVNLKSVVAYVLHAGRNAMRARGEVRTVAVDATSPGSWHVHTPAGVQPVLAPRARTPSAPAAALGRNTRDVLEEVAVQC